MTESELAELLQRPAISIPQYADLLGISRGLAYEAARRGEVATIEVGKRKLVITAPLRRQLGMDAA